MLPRSPPAVRSGHPIRVLIVDDSIVARAVLARILAPELGFEVAGQCATAEAAIDFVNRQSVEIIVLDLNMPGLSGLDAIPQLIARSNGARVLIVSSAAGTGAVATVMALRLGAADTLLKPATGALGGAFADTLIETILRIAASEGAATPPPAIETVPGSAGVAARADAVGCVAIGSSTGGVHALASFFAAYPFRASAPILVTQHLPTPFMPFFARQLGEMTGRPTRLAVDGMPVLPGTVLLAPGDGHLQLARSRGHVHVKIGRQSAPSGCMPSVDPMLESVSEVYGEKGLAVILSGMGRDGVIGGRTLADSGGEVVAQDAASSVVWGMPGAVAKAGIAQIVLPPADLARHVEGRVLAKEQTPWR
ncbi:two-component system chemotaxis response regulator CheB [Sphingomonas vulcanisoli]|uniref:protein-glutamate methylesterase n=1 Tax=Sphingomonas vulcanisoli TaxID=1658060 RepID=A0ABX0TYR1_9SPHN|nr:chemotaxis-specific protein-glutamate methyltransferase CheB [Sphingomonas vulcanisoli]NIJ08890.1 two-component system chemotaxis response regulator CheB [Sphingomonas vulcanisoli]